jgi:hypothetical protein
MAGSSQYGCRLVALYQFPSFKIGTRGVLYIHISITTLVVSAIKKYYTRSFLEVPTDFKPLLDPGGGFSIETAITKPFQKRNGYKFITAICNGNGDSPKDKIVRSGVAVM